MKFWIWRTHDTSHTEPKHLVRHRIHTDGPRRLSPEISNVVKAEFDKLLFYVQAQIKLVLCTW